MLENNDLKEIKKSPSSRESIHSEIEQVLLNKLYRVIENIEVLPSGELNFKPYDDNLLLQLESFLDKKFDQKIFREKRDTQVAAFLEKIKIEREKRDFTVLFKR